MSDVAAQSASAHSLTLITGDHVMVDAKGRVTSVKQAKGREKIPLRVYRLSGRTLVVPADAHQLMTDGRLDQRLFDIGELEKAVKYRGRDSGLRVIVGYRGAAPTAKADLLDAGDTRVRRALKVLNADVVSTPQQVASKLWNALTETDRQEGRAIASGVAQVWLDGIRTASLDKSVPRIGAPKLWNAGYDGKGVKVAVLDTGVDATHPDLKGQVIAEKNFTNSRTPRTARATAPTSRPLWPARALHLPQGPAARTRGSRRARRYSTPRCSATTAAATTPASSRPWNGPSNRARTSRT